MKKFKSVEWMEIFQRLPSPKRAFEERRDVVKINFFPLWDRANSMIRTEYMDDGTEVRKCRLTEADVITFKLNKEHSIPFWEPTEDIIILSNKS